VTDAIRDGQAGRTADQDPPDGVAGVATADAGADRAGRGEGGRTAATVTGTRKLPLRGRPLRDRYVLRLIALDRVVHFLVLGVLAAAVFLFAGNREVLSQTFYRVVDAVQGGVGGPSGEGGGGILGELQKAFAAKPSTLWIVGLIIAAYAVLEGLEAVGLWRGKRWAEYLTFIATTLLLIPEVYELTGTITVTKIITLIINVVVVGYLLFAKRLFGLRAIMLGQAPGVRLGRTRTRWPRRRGRIAAARTRGRRRRVCPVGVLAAALSCLRRRARAGSAVPSIRPGGWVSPSVAGRGG
jgi:uncharacterized membrane protein (DUF2068 family)